MILYEKKEYVIVKLHQKEMCNKIRFKEAEKG